MSFPTSPSMGQFSSQASNRYPLDSGRDLQRNAPREMPRDMPRDMSRDMSRFDDMNTGGCHNLISSGRATGYTENLAAKVQLQKAILEEQALLLDMERKKLMIAGHQDLRRNQGNQGGQRRSPGRGPRQDQRRMSGGGRGQGGGGGRGQGGGGGRGQGGGGGGGGRRQSGGGGGDKGGRNFGGSQGGQQQQRGGRGGFRGGMQGGRGGRDGSRDRKGGGRQQGQKRKMDSPGNRGSSGGNRKPDFAEPQNIPSLASSSQPPVKRKAVGNDVRTIAVIINSLYITYVSSFKSSLFPHVVHKKQVYIHVQTYKRCKVTQN
eukprot:XP_011676223.1 PREDICTED: protein argonaute 2-like [Strongylocentrotus purpuratus]